jgi:hypothetical protein
MLVFVPSRPYDAVATSRPVDGRSALWSADLLLLVVLCRGINDV